MRHDSQNARQIKPTVSALFRQMLAASRPPLVRRYAGNGREILFIGWRPLAKIGGASK